MNLSKTYFDAATRLGYRGSRTLPGYWSGYFRPPHRSQRAIPLEKNHM